MRRHFDVGHQGAVDPKTDAGLELARHRLDVDVRGLLVEGVDDDLVDELDEFVVGCRRLQRIVVGAVVDRSGVHVGQQLVDRAALGAAAKDLFEGLGKFGLCGDAIGKAGDAGNHLRHNARVAHGLRVHAHDDQTVGRLLQRQPALRFDELALERAMQHFRADAPGVEGLVRHGKKFRQRGANQRGRYLVAVEQQRLNRFGFKACCFKALRHLLRTDQALGHQAVVLGGLAPRQLGSFLHALADGDGQGFAELRNAINLEFAKGLVALVVDDLQHAVQDVTLKNRRHQHLAGAVARALVNLFQEGQGGMNLLERLAIVDVGQIEQLLAEGNIACNALRRDRQLEFPTAFEASLDLGDDGAAVFIDGIERQPLGIEQLADVLAGFEHDLLKIFGFVDAGRDLLQLPVKKRLEGHVGFGMVRMPAFQNSICRLLVLQRWFHHFIHQGHS